MKIKWEERKMKIALFAFLRIVFIVLKVSKNSHKKMKIGDMFVKA